MPPSHPSKPPVPPALPEGNEAYDMDGGDKKRKKRTTLSIIPGITAPVLIVAIILTGVLVSCSKPNESVGSDVNSTVETEQPLSDSTIKQQTEGRKTTDPVIRPTGNTVTETQTGEPTEEPTTHTHTFGDWVTVKEATCTEDGEEAKTCSVCGNKITGTIDKAPHNYVNGKCTRCGEVQPSSKPRFIVSDAKGGKGDTVTVTVTIENNPGVWGMDLLVDYDHNALTLTYVKNGDFFKDSEWTPGNLEKSVYILSYEYTSLDQNVTKKKGVLAILTFKIKQGASGSSAVTVKWNGRQQTVINVSFEDVAFDVLPGTVTVT